MMLEPTSYKILIDSYIKVIPCVTILSSFNLPILFHKHAKECSDLIQLSHIHTSPHVAT